jgi:protein subunit release factor B
MLFDITKAASQNGNHQVEITERGVAEGAAVGTLSESAIIAGETAYNWCFTEKSGSQYTRQIHYSFSKDGKRAALSF